MPRLVPFLLLAALLVGGAAWFVASPGRSALGAAEPAPAPASHTPQLQGVASCASMACHHANGPRGSWRSEYTTWATNDPHARAYTVLFEKRSLTIEKNFKGLANLEDAHPEQDRLCLNCHVQPRLEEAARHERFSPIDGVGCEACHGAAEKWVSRHYTDEWRGKTAEEKARLGMTNTKDLRVRAEVCVTCHVGSGDSDVNHDLIAAGHPRLRFEFGAYLANYPKHWSMAKDKAGRLDFEARAWLIGQLVSARAALRLLEARAVAAAQAEKQLQDDPRAEVKLAWPEFAEYDCFACHHGLQPPPSWRQLRGFPGRRAGDLPWGTWYTPLLSNLSKLPSGANEQGPLEELQRVMGRPYPPPAEVAKRVAAAAKVLDDWLPRVEGGPVSSDEVRALSASLTSFPDQTTSNPDRAIQTYLALVALHQTKPDPRLTQPLKDLRTELDAAFRLPSEAGTGVRYDSPLSFDQKKLGPLFGRIRDQLGP